MSMPELPTLTEDEPQVRFDDAPAPTRRPRSRTNSDADMMGPILRRKKVVSLPLGADPRRDAFFGGDSAASPYQHHPRTKQKSDGHLLRTVGETTAATAAVAAPGAAPPSPKTHHHHRVKVDSLVGNILKRKQVSLDLMAPAGVEFFGGDEDIDVMPTSPEGDEEEGEDGGLGPESEDVKAAGTKTKKPIKPLQFAPRVYPRGIKGGHAGGGHGGGGGMVAAGPDDETKKLVEKQVEDNHKLQEDIDVLTQKLKEEDGEHGMYEILLRNVSTAQQEIQTDTNALQAKVLGVTTGIAVSSSTPEEAGDDGSLPKEMDEDGCDIDEDDGIIRAGRSDKIKAAILTSLMIGLTIVVCVWETHLDESHFYFGPVGLACVTPCPGSLEDQDYFYGHSTFSTGEFIDLKMGLDPHENHTVHADVQIVGAETGLLKANVTFGPPSAEHRTYYEHQIKVDFEDPGEEHIINVFASDGITELGFTLYATTLSPLAEYRCYHCCRYHDHRVRSYLGRGYSSHPHCNLWFHGCIALCIHHP